MDSPLSEGWARYAAPIRASVNPSGDARLRVEEPERGWRLVDIVGAPRRAAVYCFGGQEPCGPSASEPDVCDCSLTMTPHPLGAVGCDYAYPDAPCPCGWLKYAHLYGARGCAFGD